MTILAIDLGKFNSVLVWFEPETRATAFRTMKTAPELLRVELLRQPFAQIVFEACSQAGRVHDLCEELKLPALVASTTGAAWQWKRVKRKTDRDDALKLTRRELVGRRVACQNRMRALFAGQGMPTPRGASAWSSTGIPHLPRYSIST